MLHFVLGRAGSGKTSYAMNQMRTAIIKQRRNLYFVVPEQYSHEAERQLLTICGDQLSLYGEVLSFTRMCSRVFSETGGISMDLLDEGGRLLLMSQAVTALSGHLHHYNYPDQTVDFLEKLLSAAKELKSSCITPIQLEKTAARASQPFKSKLLDLSSIMGTFDAFFDSQTANPDDRLDRLAQEIKKSTAFADGHMWLDGFSDFTVQEQRVLEELMRMGVELTICLTCDALTSDDDIFSIARKTITLLQRKAADLGIQSECQFCVHNNDQKHTALVFLERHLFSADIATCAEAGNALRVYKAISPDTECEQAAASVRELLSHGYRLNEIAVAVCDWDAYASFVENIFNKYDLPVFISGKSDICQKPPVAMLDRALEILVDGWKQDAIIAYIKTGLTGLDTAESYLLENYVLLWNIQGKAWTRNIDWTMSPYGYERDFNDDTQLLLAKLNKARRALTEPLLELQQGLKAAANFAEKVAALYHFTQLVNLPDMIAFKAAVFLEQEQLQLTREYEQLWELMVHAFDQFYERAGNITGSTSDFKKLWRLFVSQYQLSEIPISLDRITVGELSRVRRRGCKCLIVLGASDDALPSTVGSESIFSEVERREAASLGLPLPGAVEERLMRTMSDIYSTLTTPSDKLYVSYSVNSTRGAEQKPSIIVKRLIKMFTMEERYDKFDTFRGSAPRPAFELAASSCCDHQSPLAAAAAAYFQNHPDYKDRFDLIMNSGRKRRKNLSRDSAGALFGRNLVMSASRIDKFGACRYLYFLQYGLNARVRKPAGFDAPTAGTFMHYILENATRDARAAGIDTIDPEACRQLTNKYASLYVAETLDNFKDKTSRFRYLFERIVRDAEAVVQEMIEELKASDFVPVDFELEFSKQGAIKPWVLENAQSEMKINGFVDRVDAWLHKDKLYLRVVDYKTGKKTFKLSDVLYGMNMQMLLYLFTLARNGADYYGKELVPAGILYIPARDEIVQASRSIRDDELKALRAKKLRRSGMLLSEPDVIDAMERGDTKKYLPVKVKQESYESDSLITREQLFLLSNYIDGYLGCMDRHIRDGQIQAEPYYKNQNDYACLTCDFAEACRFDEALGDKRRFLKKASNEEALRLILEAEQQ